jgi:hypothetical protein
MGDRTSIMDRQHRLLRRIRAFHAKNYLVIDGIANNDSNIIPHPISFDEDEILQDDEDPEDMMAFEDDDNDEEEEEEEGGGGEDEEREEDGEDDEISAVNDEEEESPERMQLMMPSSLNATDIIHLGVEDLAAQELELRKGQANDALERLRLALANKALLWRTKVHAANTTKKRTRAWADIKKVRQQVEQHVRCYHRARHALANLGADLETMEKYKKIGKADLRLSGDVVDPSRLGQRNDSLAWFWRTGGYNAEQEDSWMQECT